MCGEPPSAVEVRLRTTQGDLRIVASVFSGEGRVRAEPFDAIELELGAVWKGRG